MLAVPQLVLFIEFAPDELASPGPRVIAPAVMPVRPGLWAVSSFLMCCGPEATAFHGDPAGAAGFGRLRQAVSARGTPVDRVGYSIVLYDLKDR